MPRFTPRELLLVLLLASGLALYIWLPFIVSVPQEDPKLLVKGHFLGPVDLNRASRWELQALPGIGPVLADRIVRYRIRSGPFRRPEELMNVEGIGRKRYERLKPWIRIGEDVLPGQARSLRRTVGPSAPPDRAGGA